MTAKRVTFDQNASQVIGFADSILEYGLAPGVLVLDSRWERKYGDLEFNKTTFPDARGVVQILRNKGFRVLLTISPFISIEAAILSDCSRNNRVISDPHLSVPLLTQCFGRGSSQMCALLDMMNATTRDWFRKQLKHKVGDHATGWID